MTNHSDYTRHNITLKNSKISKIISWVCWFGVGVVVVLGILFKLDLMLPGILIFSGLALIFEQISRKIMTYQKAKMEDRMYKMKNNKKGWLILFTVVAFTGVFTIGLCLILVNSSKEVVLTFFAICIGLILFGSINSKKHTVKYTELKEDPIPQEQKIEYTKTLNVVSNLPIIEQYKAYVEQIEKANELILDEQITKDLSAISRHVSDIYMFAAKDKAAQAHIRKFANIYLPMMIKMCDRYIELNGMALETPTAKELKGQIAEGIGNAKKAFATLNENLLQNASFDIKAEIEAFENILTIDGLLGGGEFDLPKKDGEQEET